MNHNSVAASAAVVVAVFVFKLCIDVFESESKCYHNFRAAQGFSLPKEEKNTKQTTTIKNYNNDNNEQQFP